MHLTHPKKLSSPRGAYLGKIGVAPTFSLLSLPSSDHSAAASPIRARRQRPPLDAPPHARSLLAVCPARAVVLAVTEPLAEACSDARLRAQSRSRGVASPLRALPLRPSSERRPAPSPSPPLRAAARWSLGASSPRRAAGGCCSGGGGG